MALDRTQVSVGDTLPARTVHLDRAALVRYAGASLDQNPIHWDERFAKSVGLPDVIAHGMLTMGAAVQVVVDWAGDAGRVVRYGTKFTAPVVVDHESGADVEVGGTVKKVEGDLATVDITATYGGRKVLGRAQAVVRLD